MPESGKNNPPLSWQIHFTQGDKTMAKGVESKKQAKKQPTKTLKEKRAEKKAKKAARGY